MTGRPCVGRDGRGSPGASQRCARSRTDWFSSMKPPSKPTSPGCAAEASRANGSMALRPLGNGPRRPSLPGLTQNALIAPWMIRGAMDGLAFETYVKTQLAPALDPGTVVILDNLSTHKNPHAAQALKDKGCWFLFLPPYSPDLNPPLGACYTCTCRSADRNGILKAESPPAQDRSKNIRRPLPGPW